jgi:hypothetical protein
MYFVTENIAEFQKSQKCGCESQNTQQNRDLENVMLKERNTLLLESQEHHHTFTLDMCQHAHTQHMELLNVSNKFYEWAKEWSNAEKDMTEFVGTEECKFE